MRLINVYEVSHITGLNENTIWDYQQNGHFPVPVQFGPYAASYLWADEEIQLWIYNVLRERDYQIRDMEEEKTKVTPPIYQNEQWEHLHHFIHNDNKLLNSPTEERLPKNVKTVL